MTIAGIDDRRGVAVRCSAASCCCRRVVDHGTEQVEARRRARDLHEGRRRPTGQIAGGAGRSSTATTRNVKSAIAYLDHRTTRTTSSRSIFADQPDARRDEHRRADLPESFRVVPTKAELTETVAERVRDRTRASTRSTRPAKQVKALLDVTTLDPAAIFIVISLRAAGVVAVPDREHDPPRDVRPPARDRGDEARRRVELVRARAVHGRGHGAGHRRRRARDHRGGVAQALRASTRRSTTATASSASSSSPRGDATCIALHRPASSAS